MKDNKQPRCAFRTVSRNQKPEGQAKYGYRKITAILKKEMRINHKTVQRIMQKISGSAGFR